MRITELLDKRSIRIDGAPKSKNEALDQMVELMAKSGKINDLEAYRQEVYRCEEEGTTGVGEGIAIPHGKCDAVKAPGLAAMVIKNGVEYESLDGEPVTLLFLIAAPNTKDNVHLDVLSKLSVMLMDENFTTSLRNAKSVDEFLQIIDAADESAKSIDDRLSDTGITTEEKKGFKLLAVTSCPTGIAHTYMAAEALEKAARAADCQIKIETRGSAGAKNVLTAEEIEAADCIIVAADAKVPMDRFNGKKVISCQVSDGIGKADQLVKQAMSGNVEVFHGESSETTTAVTGKESAAHKIYTQLMNGVSHMLPFVVGGGILIAIAFLIDGLNVDINALPADQRSNFGTITPIAAMFKNIGGVAFGLMLPVLAGFIGMAIGDRPALALGFVGGMMAANGKSGFLGALVAGFLAGYTIVFLRKIVKGGADKSYGIQVAKLAGVPDNVIERAKEIVEELSNNDITEIVQNISAEGSSKRSKPKLDEVDLEQISLLDTMDNDTILNELKELDLGQMTPIEAMNKLYELQNKVKNRW